MMRHRFRASVAVVCLISPYGVQALRRCFLISAALKCMHFSIQGDDSDLTFDRVRDVGRYIKFQMDIFVIGNEKVDRSLLFIALAFFSFLPKVLIINFLTQVRVNSFYKAGKHTFVVGRNRRRIVLKKFSFP